MHNNQNFALDKNTIVTVDNAQQVIELANLEIENLKKQYGHIPIGWKPMPVRHAHLFVKRAEAEKLLKREKTNE